MLSMQSQFKYIFVLLLSVWVLSSCDEDRYADWKILNETWLENLKEENKDNPDFVVTESGLCYQIIHMGSNTRPNGGSYVEVSYKGTYLNGKSFDSGVYKRPLLEAIPGWREAIPKITRGGRIILYIPANLGYGDEGSGKIPPYSTLKFDLTLDYVINYY
jgi:FKBP-type peptidyl-prolyl cis-trans isomerase